MVTEVTVKLIEAQAARVIMASFDDVVTSAMVASVTPPASRRPGWKRWTAPARAWWNPKIKGRLRHRCRRHPAIPIDGGPKKWKKKCRMSNC